MMEMHFRKLKSWDKAMKLAMLVYQTTKGFPREEIYGLASQMRRAAVSVPSNLAEGSQRTTDKDFAHFVLLAKGSLAELETQCVLATQLGYMSERVMKNFLTDFDELNRMLYSLHSKLAARDS